MYTALSELIDIAWPGFRGRCPRLSYFFPFEENFLSKLFRKVSGIGHLVCCRRDAGATFSSVTEVIIAVKIALDFTGKVG